MKRDPSIHITKSKFIKLWATVSGNNDVPHDIIDKLFSLARSNSVDNRALYIPNNKNKQQNKIISRTSASTGDANLFTDILYSIRVKLKHIGVSKIKQSDPQWVHVKNLIPEVNNFCSTYNLQKRKGYLEFIEIGFKLLSQTNKPNYQYCASWFLKNYSGIVSYYDNCIKLNNDSNPEGTREIYNIYTSKVLDMVGISNNYRSQPDKYVYFLQAREMADNIGVDYEDFIQAQFEALEFCNGIPNIEDLSGDRANQRLVRYLSKHNININVLKPETKDFDWSDFKK